MSISRNLCRLTIVLFAALVLTACAGTPARSQRVPTLLAPQTVTEASQTPTSGATTSPTQESTAEPEANPADIPDEQVFVNYAASPGNYALDVPEGWARTMDGSNVRFVSKFNGLSVVLTSAASAPTVSNVRQNEVAALTQAGHAFQLEQVTEMDLPGGHVVKIIATLNSDSDPVTLKQVRLDESVYLFHKDGTEAMLRLWSPQGVDNVDPWNQIASSFRWK